MKQLNSCERTFCRTVSSRALQLQHRKPGEARRQRPATEPCLCYTLCPCCLAPARQKCLHSSSIIYIFVVDLPSAHERPHLYIPRTCRHHRLMCAVVRTIQEWQPRPVLLDVRPSMSYSTPTCDSCARTDNYSTV